MKEWSLEQLRNLSASQSFNNRGEQFESKLWVMFRPVSEARRTVSLPVSYPLSPNYLLKVKS